MHFLAEDAGVEDDDIEGLEIDRGAFGQMP